jgi:hypothetical protein
MQYNDVKHVVFSDPSLPHAFWIFDHPNDSKMLVNVALGAAMGQGAVRGATLGIAPVSTPGDKFGQAATLFLASSGRKCSIASVERIAGDTNYEVSYTCEVAPVALSALRAELPKQ